MKEGVESTQHRCQTPTARGQAGVDLGVNQQAPSRQQDGACLDRTQKLRVDDGGINTQLGSEFTPWVQQFNEETIGSLLVSPEVALFLGTESLGHNFRSTISVNKERIPA